MIILLKTDQERPSAARHDPMVPFSTKGDITTLQRRELSRLRLSDPARTDAGRYITANERDAVRAKRHAVVVGTRRRGERCCLRGCRRSNHDAMFVLDPH